MKYMGSKNRIAKYILPIILKDRKEGQCYVEPFVGGFNLIDKVKENRLAADCNPYVTILFTAIQSGWLPPDNIAETEYKSASLNREVTPLVSFIGFGCSYSGKWFGGYARGNTNNGTPRNYCLESKNNILKQYEAIQGIQIEHNSYERLSIPSKSLIYCDPPYRGTTGYKDSFNHEKFYQWCRDKKAEGHTIFVSEYNMPDDFRCIWSKEQTSSLTKDTGSKRAIEKLFTL